jgi:hypothetical protein
MDATERNSNQTFEDEVPLPALSQSSGSVEVLFIVSGSTVQTFDVDRQTGSPTEQCHQGVILSAITNLAFVPSASDHLGSNDTSAGAKKHIHFRLRNFFRYQSTARGPI